MATLAGQTECVELILKAGADPHMKESVAYGTDPEEGKTALDIAKSMDWFDCIELLEQAEKKTPYGYYVPAGKNANTKVYSSFAWNKKPEKGWFFKRPGASRYNGIDAKKYGGGVLADPDDDDMDYGSAALSAPAPRMKPLPIGILFPGQGSQYVKMMSTCIGLPAVADMVE